MSEIILRYVTLEDKENWNKMWYQFRAHYDTAIPDGLNEDIFAKFLDPSVPMYSCLAFNNDTKEVVGMVNFVKHYSTWKFKEIIYLEDLYVNEKVRSQGIGRKLIDLVYKEADKMDTPYVYWTTDTFNHRAQLLYTKVADLTSKCIYERPMEH